MVRPVAALLAALLAVAAAAAAADDRPALRIGVQRNPPLFDPAHSVSNVAWRVNHNLFDTLIGLDPTDGFKLVPALATAWHRVNERTLELTLRPGVRFHDGTALTAADVVFTFGPERMSGETAPLRAQTRPLLGGIERVEAVDESTIRVVTRRPDPLIEQRLATFPAQIVSAAAYRAAPDFQAWARRPVGTGPYRLVDSRDNDFVQLAAHDAYWGGRPTASTVRFEAAPEVAARLAGLETGRYGIVTDLPPDQLARVAGRPGLEVAGGPITNTRVIVFDQNNPVLRDVRVRRALSLAIDRRLLVETLWDGRVGIPRGNQFPAFGPLYLADRPEPAYDPARARTLLREAGYRGQPIEYRINNNYYATEIATAEALAEMWKAVGLNIVLLLKENWTQILEPAGRGIRNWSNAMIYPDPAGHVWRLYGPGSPVRRGAPEWANDEFDRLGTVLEGSLDPAARLAAWSRMLTILEEDDPPAAVLHQFAIFYGKRRDITWQALPVELMELRPANLSFR
ncbi:peptide/nickel transport system substrate-binding protein [Stella humosa]|uniref:Peptide/nickel transport system substrate-binding protein n=1 Tax=Stella humosa TaxID=94 RepID=A0A3N1KZ18_9PROT|nr:ABC transporter substrate-binding protein [Stella humosa]ROP83890.1 peptide/nickel transport system substrate-binding protein [Stella humosa]BBK32848.1 ABC transporter substrate-binding protein [Stella humosa]